jgi:cysteine-rich repeat protein
MSHTRHLERKNRSAGRRLCSGASKAGALLLLVLLPSRCTVTPREFSVSGAAGNAAAPSIVAGEPCGETGLRVCAGPSQQQRLVCENGVYRPDGPCSVGSNCDQLSGACLPVIAECAGKPIGTRFCAGAEVKVCGLDLVRVESEQCEGTCVGGNCVARSCGDGVITSPEQCDDGNLGNDDGCTNDCMLATCGNGVTEPPEECDDGNTSNADACAGCRVARCGDGRAGPSEACDDGNTDNGDACSNTCTLPLCGDGTLRAGEQCDDGNALDNDACSNGCTLPRCGDAIVQVGEACDDGNAVNGDSCSSTCTVPGCGDGTTQPPNEECDDGNQSSSDACTVACKMPRCGDSFTQTGEECDDGNAINADGCTNACRLAKCGDGFVQRLSEECDDGNGNASDGCTNTCRVARCGDGVTQTGEECDDGNAVNNDTCTITCRRPTCGDGILSAGESCEDGNKLDGDGCSSSCQTEVCGDNKKTGTEECDDGNRTDNDGCSAVCRIEVCGDGIVQRPREDCEDKNTVDTDLCRNGCKNAASLNALSADCQNIGQIMQTVCMTAVTNWCKQFNNSPVAGMVTGQKADNEYRVGCISGLKRHDVGSSLLEDKCAPGRQQSPACLERAEAACHALGSYKLGFYLGPGAAAGTTALACGAGTKTATESVPTCNGIVESNPVPVACANALAEKCGSGKAGMIQARAQANQVSYTCVELSLTGSARFR